MKPRTTLSKVIAAMAVLSLFFASCGSSSDSKSEKEFTESTEPSGGDSSPTSVGSGDQDGGDETSSEPSKEGGSKARVFHGYAPDGKTDRKLDLYDTPFPEEDDKPLIAGLGYGEISDYVDVTPDSNGWSWLYAYNAGSLEQTGDGFIGQDIYRDSAKDARVTVIIGNSTSDAGEPSYSAKVLAESPEENPINDTGLEPVEGKGKVIIAEHAIGNEEIEDLTNFVIIDDECPERVDDAMASENIAWLSNATGAPFVVEPGSHTLRVITVREGESIPEQCEPERATSSFDFEVDAGERTLVILYTSDADGSNMEAVVAPVED